MIILHFDFKSNEPELLRAVWDLLGSYEGWLTTAPKTADPNRLQPFHPKPILVITENSDAQEEVFFQWLPIGGRLRVFGSAHTRGLASEPRERRAHLAATLPPACGSRSQTRVLDPVLYARWFWGERRPGLGCRLQLRFGCGGSIALEGRSTSGSRFDRDGSIRRAARFLAPVKRQAGNVRHRLYLI